MPRVLPFVGLRYDRGRVPDLAAVVSPPYDVISPDEQRELQARSPYNAVHLELPADAPGQPGSRYRCAAETLAAWRREGLLRPDPRPAYYLSETSFSFGGQALRRRDVLAALGVDPWASGTVLPHEHTMPAPKADRLELLRATHVNVSPIWVLARDQLPTLTAAWTAAEARDPDVAFTWRDEEHRLWLIDDPALTSQIEAEFTSGGPLYIADGHHRYETSLAYASEAGPQLPGASAMLAAITWAEDPGLLALPTHRLLSHLDSELTLEELETRWADVFHIEYYPVWEDAPPEQVDALMQQLASQARVAPTFGVLGLGQHDLFGVLEVRGRSVPPGRLPTDRSEAWKALDVALLHTLLVDPLVQESGHPREEVLGYTRDPHAAFAAVRDGHARAAFFLNPTPVQQVLAVADAHDRMPEKSTYFYPKPPAGLVLRDLAT
jgi:uncharacterized protein (DUF1015 family)